MNILKLIIAWTWVAVPLGWGVYQSVQTSRPLFQEQATPDDTATDDEPPSSADRRD